MPCEAEDFLVNNLMSLYIHIPCIYSKVMKNVNILINIFCLNFSKKSN